jgi:integrase
MKDGREVIYYRPRDPVTRKRLPGISTGLANEREAYKYCEKLLDEGKLIPEKKATRPTAEVRRSRRPPTLREWSDERHWWQWTDDGPVCEYCKGELERSPVDAPAVQRDHADRSARILRLNILPSHGDKRIDQITPTDLEDIMKAWKEEGRASKTINNRASVYRVMMAEAERLKFIPENPWNRVKAYYVQENPKGKLDMKEYVKLMNPATVKTIWDDNYIYYVANLLSSVTGLRQGEVLALKADQIFSDHIIVEHSYQRKYGLGPQKTKRGTDEIPIPRLVYEKVKPLLSWGGFVFSFSGGKLPCSGNRCNDALKAALKKIGIDKDEQQKRKIMFHSWRVFANTYFLSVGVSADKVRDITRHETEAMTEHYTGFLLEDFREIADAQGSLVSLLQCTKEKTIAES